MPTQIIQQGDTILINSKFEEKRIIQMMILKNMVPLLIWIGAVIYLLNHSIVASLLLLFVAVPFLLKSFNYNVFYFFKNQIALIQTATHIQANKKIIPWNDILFLSIREDEDYAYIRLEAKRKSILIKNEKLLALGCTSLEEALQICRQVKSLLHQEVRINQIVMQRNANGDVRENENWKFLE